MTAPSLDALKTEVAGLILPRFAEAEALLLGSLLVGMAQARGLGVVIDIRSPARTLFHAALPGSAPLHALWVERKSATALLFQEATMIIGTRNRAAGETLAKHGLDPAAYADNGGAVPVVVAGQGMVAVVTVSGLPQAEDHRLAVEGLKALIDQL